MSNIGAGELAGDRVGESEVSNEYTRWLEVELGAGQVALVESGPVFPGAKEDHILGQRFWDVGKEED